MLSVMIIVIGNGISNPSSNLNTRRVCDYFMFVILFIIINSDSNSISNIDLQKYKVFFSHNQFLTVNF